MNARLPVKVQNPNQPHDGTTAMVGGEQEQLLVQESAVRVISSGAQPSCTAHRLAYFLHPRAAGGTHRPALPSPPRNNGRLLADGQLQVQFKGWAESPILWRRWVDKLRPLHERRWRTVGILDAILATTCRVRRDDGAMLHLASIWSAETNTFIFPWGEATVTLEDVAVLGGLPLLGRAVCAPLEGAFPGDVEALQAVLYALCRSKSHKADQPAWAMRFLQPPSGQGPAARDSEAARLLEHGAFLAMWLSLYVLAAPPFDVIRADVLPVAARLARGECVALAPAALAGIYSDLSGLNSYMNLDKRYQPYVAWAPLHILQLWVLARFPELRPERATTVLDPVARNQPWAARWDEVQKEIDPMYVHAVFMSPSEFEWRPYGTNSFAPPPPEKACSWFHGRDIAASKQLQSFARCLRACELVGMRSIEHRGLIEQYNPHRVARQLGFDQDVPGSVARVNSYWEIAWETYTMDPRNFAFIVPQYTLAVTVEYAKWWEPYSLACAAAVANSAKLKELRALVGTSGEHMKVLHDHNASKQEAHELVIKQNTSSEHGDLAYHHLLKGALRTTSSKATGSATVAHLQSSLEDIVMTTDDESDELVGKEHEVGAMQVEGNEKADKDASASNKQSESLLEDRAVVNRKRSGNNKMSSSNPFDASPELPKRVISTNTLYYLKPFGRVKDAQDGDAARTNADQGAYLPRREIGTSEMIEEASAAREAENVVLQITVDSLKEEIAAAQAQLRDSNPSKA